MSSLILRTAAPVIATGMLLFSAIVLLRGHNDPGGSFIAGLIAASATAILGLSSGVGAVRRMLRINPIAIAGFGVATAIFSGALSMFAAAPFLTGLWLPGYLLGTPGLFDVGVYFTVFGAVSAIILVLEDVGEEI